MKYLIVLLSLILSGCETTPGKLTPMGPPPPAPVIKAFSDSKAFMLMKDMTYTIGDVDQTIVVPEGFVTDFASVPKALWSLGLSPHEKFSRAAIIHDYLYWSQVCTRAQADNIMLLAMERSGVSKKTQFTMFQGVNMGGVSAWEENKADRESGLPRVISEGFREFPADVNWAEYEQVLVDNAVKDPVFIENPSYCNVGDSNYSDQVIHFFGN